MSKSSTDKQRKLLELSGRKTSNWQKESEKWLKNISWQKKSIAIALQVKRVLRERGMSQQELAEKLNVSPQQMSKWLKGKENFRLSTIDSFEKTLGVELVHIPIPNYRENTMYTIEKMINTPLEIQSKDGALTKLNYFQAMRAAKEAGELLSKYFTMNNRQKELGYTRNIQTSNIACYMFEYESNEETQSA